MVTKVAKVVKKEKKVSKGVKNEIRLIAKLEQAIIEDSKIIHEKEGLIKRLNSGDWKPKFEKRLKELVEKNSKNKLILELKLDHKEIKEVEHIIKLLQKAIKEEQLVKHEDIMSTEIREKLTKIMGQLEGLDRQELLDELKVLKLLHIIEHDVKNSVDLILEQKRILEK